MCVMSVATYSTVLYDLYILLFSVVWKLSASLFLINIFL